MKKHNISAEFREELGNAEERLTQKVNENVIGKVGAAVRGKPRLKAFCAKLLEFIDDLDRDNVGLYAAQSAFFTILSAVPCLMLILLCIKYFVTIDISSISEPIRRAFPDPLASYIIRTISEVFYLSDSTTQLSITVIAVLWSASRGMMALYSGLNNMFGYTKSNNWFAARIVSYFYTVLFITVIAAALIVLIFGNSILKHIDVEIAMPSYVLKGIFNLKYPIFFILFILAFASLYTFLPQRKLRYKMQLPGAIFTAVGWITFSYGFSIYVQYFSKYSVIYGSLTAIVLLMLWMYFCLYMLLLGAEINKHTANGYFRELIGTLAK